jgi:hypothetical protein
MPKLVVFTLGSIDSTVHVHMAQMRYFSYDSTMSVTLIPSGILITVTPRSGGLWRVRPIELGNHIQYIFMVYVH